MSDAFAAYRAEDFNALSDEGFRALARRFLEAHHPVGIRHPAKRLHWAEVKPWYMTLSAAGWLAPAWPRAFGGMGLSAAKQLIYTDEFERFGAARSPDMGVNLIGPLLTTYGTDAQRARFLPRILSGEDIWCQGYSEPNAGSDLAALNTQAVLDREEWVVNGQKIWTTLATDANWMFALVRTDKAARKQAGISFLLIPMDAPGVTVRPILNLDMQDEFCEVFLDDVRVPRENLVGEINAGWTMAKNLLGFERIFLGSPRQAANALGRLYALAQHYGVADDPKFVDRYTTFRLDLADHECLFERMADTVRAGGALGPEVSFLKLNATDIFQRITDYAVELAGADGGLLHPIDGDRALNPIGPFFVARAATIYAGTSEVQRNILAKSVLRLP